MKLNLLSRFQIHATLAIWSLSVLLLLSVIQAQTLQALPVTIYVPNRISCQEQQLCDITEVRVIYDGNLLLQSEMYKAVFELTATSGKIFIPQKRGLVFTQGNPLQAERIIIGRGSLESVRFALSWIQYVSSLNTSTEHNVTDKISISVLPVPLSPLPTQYNSSLASGVIDITRTIRLPQLSFAAASVNCEQGQEVRVEVYMNDQQVDTALYSALITARFGVVFVAGCQVETKECLVSGTFDAIASLLSNITYRAQDVFSPRNAQDSIEITLTRFGVTYPVSKTSATVRVLQVNHKPVVASHRQWILRRGEVMRVSDFLSVSDSDAGDVLSLQILAESGFLLLLSTREKQLLDKNLVDSTMPLASWVPNFTGSRNFSNTLHLRAPSNQDALNAVYYLPEEREFVGQVQLTVGVSDVKGAAVSAAFTLLVTEFHEGPSLEVTQSYISLQEDTAVNLTDTITVRHDDMFHYATLQVNLVVNVGSIQSASTSVAGLLIDNLELKRISVKGGVGSVNAFLRNMVYTPERDINFLNSEVPTLRIEVGEFDQRTRSTIGMVVSGVVRFYIQPVDDLPVLKSNYTMYATPEDTSLVFTGLDLTDRDASEYSNSVYVLYVNASYGAVSLDAVTPNISRLIYQSPLIDEIANKLHTLRYIPPLHWSGLDHITLQVITLSGPLTASDGKIACCFAYYSLLKSSYVFLFLFFSC